MASPLTEKTLIQIRSFQDPETGCSASDKAAFELCKQSFYLKQQNEILQQPPTDSRLQQENVELKLQLEEIKQEIETLKSQQVIPQPEARADNNLLAASISGATLPTISLVFVLGISVAFLVGRKFFKKQ